MQVVHTLHGINALPAASSYFGRRMPQEIRQSKGFGRRPRQVKRSSSVLLWSQRHTLTSSQSSSTVFLDYCTKRHLVFIHCGLASSRYSSCVGLSQQDHHHLLERLSCTANILDLMSALREYRTNPCSNEDPSILYYSTTHI